MLEVIKREAIYLWYYFDIQLRQIVWYWVLGILLGSAISVFAKSRIHQAAEFLGQRVPGIVGLIFASALGIASPLCMYGTIPICAAFSKKGIQNDFLAAFMMSSILLNPQLIIFSSALGAKILAVRIISCFLCGVVAGLLVRAYCARNGRKTKHNYNGEGGAEATFNRGCFENDMKCQQNKNMIENSGDCAETANCRNRCEVCSCASEQSNAESEWIAMPQTTCNDRSYMPVLKETEERSYFDFSKFNEVRNNDTDKNVFLRYVKNVLRNVRATGLWFLLGIVLSAVFQRYVPADVMQNIFCGNKAWGVLMAATIGVPLYVCGGGTIPLLLDWLAQGMSAGSAAAFMITGPATKITNLGALKIVLGFKHFAIYLLFVILFSFLTGLVVNVVM
ncbi:MAG: permease [Treponema sp.]|nr:permease [Treponema sp.]